MRHHHHHGWWDFGPRFMARHGGGRGFGGFGPFGGGGPGFGGAGFRLGRMLASGDLQLIVLALLGEKPRHGYEVIKAIEERTRGVYAPSPGMVYPALTYLEEIGHATVEAEGAKKLYRITPAGEAYLAENRELAADMLAQLARFGRKMERVRQFFRGEEDEAEEPGDPEGLRAARRDLKAALVERQDAPAEERARIAAILRGAAAAIRGH